MVSTMRFVGASVDALLEFDDANSFGTDVASAASVLLATLNPLGDPFEVPWKLKESLSVLDPWVPADLEMRLLNPGMSVPSNHLEATVLSLAREGGVCLEPLTAADIRRMQHGAQQAIEAGVWGRQSPHPWDTLAEAEVDPSWFYAFAAPLVMPLASAA